MQPRILLLLLFVFTTFTASASMRIEVLNLKTSQVRLIYELDDNKTGNSLFIFPSGGFIHSATKGEFKVESIFDVATRQELNYEITLDSDSKNPQLKIKYPEAILSGQKKTMQISVVINLPDEMLSVDNQGRATLTYTTSHAFEFIIPYNHYVVYSNQPVYLFEKGQDIIVQQLEKKARKIVIQTRPKNPL